MSAYVVVVVEFAVGDGDGGGPLDHIDEAVSGLGERHVVDPHVVRAEHRDGVAVALGPEADVVGRVPDRPAVSRDDVMDPDVVDDDILDKLESEAGAIGDVDKHAPAIDGLVASHDQLLLKTNHHAVCKDDPQGLVLGHGVTQGSRLRVHHVVIGRVVHHVKVPVLASGGSVSEPSSTLGQQFPVIVPVGVAPPATVDRVRRLATIFANQIPPCSII